MTDTQAITVRLPEDVYEHLRREAFERRVSQSSIIIGTLEERFGLRPDGSEHELRMPVSAEEFDIAKSVLLKVLMVIRPEDEAKAEAEADTI